MTTRVKAPIQLLTAPDFRDKTATITADTRGEAPMFYLCGPSQVAVAYCRHPKPLSAYAWANGAHEVVHDFDLGLADD